MGTGASTAKAKPAHVENRTPQDDAMSFRGKVGALKLIINSDGSKSALMKYLNDKGIACILTYYFEIDELKRGNRDLFITKAKELRAKYDPKNMSSPASPTQIEIWNTVDETLTLEEDGVAVDPNEIVKNLKISQDYIFSMLSKLLDGFLQSHYYSEWEQVQHEDMDRNKKNHDKVDFDANIRTKYPNLLIVDDSPVSSKNTAAILEHIGHRARQANHGRVAQEVITGARFNVILIELSMTTMDPFDLAKKMKIWDKENEIKAVPPPAGADPSKPVIRKPGQGPTTPITIVGVMVDGHNSAINVGKEFFDYFIPGPFSAESLYEVLQKKEEALNSARPNPAPEPAPEAAVATN